jgi:hypothetical protein
MKPENWISIAGFLLTAIVTALGLYLGPKFAVKRSIEQFRSQKWWESQEDAYRTLLQDLTIAKQYLLDEWESITRGESAPNSARRSRFFEAISSIELQVYTGPYLLSEETIKAALAFLSRLSNQKGDLRDDLDKTSDAIIKCVDIVREEAQKQLAH